MDRQALVDAIFQKQTYLCVGLDTEPARIPAFLKREKDPVFAFNKLIIDATHPYCVAYKPNVAFYEAMGPQGWETLMKTLEYMPDDAFAIADAKRGDIGHSSGKYAEAFFETCNFDAVTVSPYMGNDSITPFLSYTDKWTIVLALTSNAGSQDFQLLESGGKPLYEHVMEKATQWAGADQLMFVIGATRPEELARLRALFPDHFFLLPGVGKQGGDLELISKNGLSRDHGGLLVNVGRSLIYCSDGNDISAQVAEKAKNYQKVMKEMLEF